MRPGQPEPERPQLDPAALADPSNGAGVRLVLIVALRAAPSPDEVYAVLAAFRRCFEPEAASVKRLSEWSSDPFTQWSADDPVLAAAIGEPGQGGAFGVTVTLDGTPSPSPRAPVEGPSLTIHAPGPEEPRRASYVLATLPPGTDPAAVRRLALELAEQLPFVSGYASYAGFARGNEAVATAYRWARRYMALDAQDLRLELRGLRGAVKGAGWLTLVGAPVADALRDRFGEDALRFEAPEIAVNARRHGLVIEAGTLGLGHRAEGFFTAIAEVDRRLAPLRLTLGNDEMLSIGGNFYSAHYAGYDGPLGEGGGSYEWLERWIRPEVWLGPTPRDRAEALLAALPGGAAKLAAQPMSIHWSELLRILVNATHQQESTDEGLAALAFAARFPGRVQPSALANLLAGYLQRGELERGAELVELAVSLGEENPLLLHNAACVLARRGEPDRAIELVRSAREHGYKNWLSMHTDEDLASLRGRPAFEAIFAEPG